MTMNLIMLLVFYPVLLMIYAMMYSEAKPRKNIILGVTLPFTARQDEGVLAIVRTYKRALVLTGIALAVLPVVLMLWKSSSSRMTFYMTWMLLIVIVPYIPYTLAHRKLKQVKQTQGWVPANAGKTLLDVRASTQVSTKPVRTVWFLVSFLVSLLPIVGIALSDMDGKGATALMFAVNTLMIVLFYLFYRIIYRQRLDIVDENTALTVALTQVRRYNWSKAWVLLSLLTALFNVALWALLSARGGTMVVILLYTAAIFIVSIHTEFAARRGQYALTQNSGTDDYADDDRYWINGMFYYNPNDKHLMVNARTGMNTTINLASPAGMAIMGLSILTLLLSPLLGVWLGQLEKTPVTLMMNETAVIASHTKEEYRVELADIERVTLLSPIPPGTRLMGTGMDTVNTGKFRLEGVGECAVCFDPRVNAALWIVANGKSYVFNDADPAVANEIYARLMGNVPAVP